MVMMHNHKHDNGGDRDSFEYAHCHDRGQEQASDRDRAHLDDRFDHGDSDDPGLVDQGSIRLRGSLERALCLDAFSRALPYGCAGMSAPPFAVVATRCVVCAVGLCLRARTFFCHFTIFLVASFSASADAFHAISARLVLVVFRQERNDADPSFTNCQSLPVPRLSCVAGGSFGMRAGESAGIDVSATSCLDPRGAYAADADNNDYDFYCDSSS